MPMPIIANVSNSVCTKMRLSINTNKIKIKYSNQTFIDRLEPVSCIRFVNAIEAMIQSMNVNMKGGAGMKSWPIVMVISMAVAKGRLKIWMEYLKSL